MNWAFDEREPVCRIEYGLGASVATAVHDGHAVREEVAQLLALGDAERLREEDPYTALWTHIAPTRVVGLRSRFEVDLNRPRERAVYVKPDDAWGLQVWKHDPPEGLVQRSLAEYDAFYTTMCSALEAIRLRHGRFVVFDLHTYNHCREGRDGPMADPDANPQVNLGTGTMDRARWAPVVERFIEALRAFDFPGGRLDVRENVRFRGGNFPRWVHETFPDCGVALAIEVKKFFMNEWTGEADQGLIEAIHNALQSTVSGVLEELRRL
jgi:N-formylglutamate amidohydrolase